MRIVARTSWSSLSVSSISGASPANIPAEVIVHPSLFFLVSAFVSRNSYLVQGQDAAGLEGTSRT